MKDVIDRVGRVLDRIFIKFRTVFFYWWIITGGIFGLLFFIFRPFFFADSENADWITQFIGSLLAGLLLWPLIALVGVLLFITIILSYLTIIETEPEVFIRIGEPMALAFIEITLGIIIATMISSFIPSSPPRHVPKIEIKERITKEILRTDTILSYDHKPQSKVTPSQQYITEDGHQVRSRAEMIIDNLLSDLKINHYYEHQITLSGIRLRPDWYLPDYQVYIEFWGMESQKEYAENQRRKLKLYAEHNIPCLSLNDSDMEDYRRLKGRIMDFVRRYM